MRARVAIALIAFAELLGTSLWFSANGVADALVTVWGIDASALGQLTSAVQAGFITGTLALALTGLADRWPPERIFLAASIFGALANLGFILPGNGFTAACAWRFLTGLALAGIYPLGMKLIVSWAPERAGRALGWLVGMLVLGTSLPHLFRGLSLDPDWRVTLALSSALAAIGGLVVMFVGAGPHRVAAARGFNWSGALNAFRDRQFRAAAGGYFGHMWELYALWTATPFLVRAALPDGASAALTSLASFAFIAAGAAGCVLGGVFSDRLGSARIAALALAVSGALCILYPLLDAASPPRAVAALLLLLWGVAVVADSPQFSALIARHAPADATGSALSIVNGIGFLISIVSISLLMPLWESRASGALWLLAPGPVLGLLLMWPLRPARRDGPARESRGGHA